MSKVNLEIKMITNNEERNLSLIGIRNEKKIKYIDDESHIEVDFSDKSIKIDNPDYSIVLTFDINEAKILNYKLKKFNKEIVLNIKTKRLEVDYDSFFVDYELIDNDSTISCVSYELHIGGLNG